MLASLIDSVFCGLHSAVGWDYRAIFELPEGGRVSRGELLNRSAARPLPNPIFSVLFEES